MTKETVQFIEAVRQAAAKLPPSHSHPLYCPNCGRCTDHSLTSSRDEQWEYYTCLKCGCQETYRVK